MKNSQNTDVEHIFKSALDAPVPPVLIANIHAAARRQVFARAWQRRIVWILAPAAAAVVIMAGFLATAPRTDSPSVVQTPAPRHHAQILVSLAAGGDMYSEDNDVDTLAQGLLSLQGFCADD